MVMMRLQMLKIAPLTSFTILLPYKLDLMLSLSPHPIGMGGVGRDSPTLFKAGYLMVIRPHLGAIFGTQF
jgi:hypothetical protein